MSNSQQTHQTLIRGVEKLLPKVDSLIKLMEKQKIRVYLGIDPTGSLLTLGHAVVLKKLQQFADLGHEVILLIGNGTVKIGDPTGSDSTRPELSEEEIEKNFTNWKNQASKILDFDKITIKKNGDWLNQLSYSDIVKLMAKTTVQQLLERDMFQDRMAKNLPIFGHEIIYPLLQGYDSVVMDVDLEIGGSDQLFNMMMGRTLQKSYHDKEKWVLTTPIINGTDGRKMSKSYNNFIALTENPNDMYGKLMSVADAEIITYFTILTDVSLEEIEKMKQAIEAGDNPMTFKKRLAWEITTWLHDKNSADQAQQHFENTVQGGELIPTDQSQPITEKTSNIIDVIKKCPSNRSNSELRRLIEQGGVIIIFKNGKQEKPTDPSQTYSVNDIDMIKVGKREVYKIISKR